jgi:hypothetical protein
MKSLSTPSSIHHHDVTSAREITIDVNDSQGTIVQSIECE